MANKKFRRDGQAGRTGSRPCGDMGLTREAVAERDVVAVADERKCGGAIADATADDPLGVLGDGYRHEGAAFVMAADTDLASAVCPPRLRCLEGSLGGIGENNAYDVGDAWGLVPVFELVGEPHDQLVAGPEGRSTNDFSVSPDAAADRTGAGKRTQFSP